MTAAPGSGDPLAAVVQALESAWEERSGAERAAFRSGLDGRQGEPDVPQEALLVARRRAALSGAVAPGDLVRGGWEDWRDAVLDLLAPDCDRFLLEAGWRWTLQSAPRRATLERLRDAGGLTEALVDVAAIATDAAGRILRKLAAEGPLPGGLLDTPVRADLQILVQALAWAVPVEPEAAGLLAEARRRSAIAALVDGCRKLVGEGIVGRERALRRLRSFAERWTDGYGLPFLPIVGVGGVGKSTLLAALMAPLLERMADDPGAPAVVLIDFDRVLFRVGAEVELSFEVSRQLGAAVPAAAGEFATLRERVRRERRESGEEFEGGAREYESFRSRSETFEMRAYGIARRHGLHKRPVLLVLDTFEEWQRDRPVPEVPRAPWNDPEQRILEWVANLRDKMGLGGLRVVASGRAPVEARVGAITLERPLVLGDLGPRAAERLLQRQGLFGGEARRLAGLAGGSPLTLKIAARYYASLPEGERNDFLAGSMDDLTGLDATLRRGLLYDRFLDHVPDERVRKLAHPGLVLRRVTPEIVRHVLARSCGLGEVDQALAEELVDKLADEVWLVRRTDDGLRHHRDARRAMLRLMSNDPERQAQVGEIHKAAVEWYSSGRDPTLKGEDAEAEALYHQLAGAPEGWRLPVTWKGWTDADSPPRGGDRRFLRLARRLGDSFGDLAPSVAAQLRLALGEELSEAGAAPLPAEDRSRWIESRGKTFVASDRPEDALALLSRLPPGTVQPPFFSWEAQAYLDAGRWRDYWPAMVRSHFSDLPGWRWERLSGKYAFLNAALSGERSAVQAYCRFLVYFLEYAPPKAPRKIASGLLERAFAALLLDKEPVNTTAPPDKLRLIWNTDLYRAGWDKIERDELRRDSLPVDYCRWLLLQVCRGSVVSIGVPQQIIHGLFRPNSEWLRSVARALPSRRHQESAKRFADTFSDYADGLLGRPLGDPVSSETRVPLPSEGTSTEILTDWAARFARELGGDIKLHAGLFRRHPDTLRVLRGDNPELRPAIRRKLAEAYSGHEGFGELGAIVAGCLPFVPVDLVPDRLAVDGGRRPRETLVKLVEYVDRAGATREFLATAALRRPSSPGLAAMRDAFAAWDDAHEALLAKLGAETTGPLWH